MIAARDFPKDYTNGLSRPHLYDGYLLNTRYKGTVVLQKTFKPNYISKQVKRNKGERPMYIYENYHKAIIPPSFYEYANSRRGNKTFEIVNDSFSSFLYCGLCTRNLKPVKKYGKRKGESYYSCNVYQDHRIIYCDLKYQDGKVIEDIVDDILGQLADIETLINKVKCQLISILSNAIGNKKKYDILKTVNEITTLKSKLKSNEALMIENPDIINDEKFKATIEATKLSINKLGRELRIIKNSDYLLDRREKCINQLDTLLNKRMIYALLAKAFNLKVIVLPNYKIILVLNKSGLDEASFRKQIHQIVEKTELSIYIDSIKIRQNGIPVNYSFTITKI